MITRFPQRKNSAVLFWGVVCGIFLLPLSFAHAYSTYAPGQTVVVGDFVYGDDYNATSTNCYVSIWGPSGSVEVNAAAMTEGSGSWYYYNYASTTQGTFPAQMSCGYSGDNSLVREDKTFIIASSSSAPSASDVATSVWSSGARTLTSFGTLASDIWSAATRTLTSGTAIAADIWSATTRTLTGADLSSGSLATQSDVQTASSSVAAVVNANTNTQTSGIASSVNSHTDAALTSASSSIAAVVNANTTNVVTAASSSLGASLTSLASALASIPSNVWSAATRTLTSGTAIAADIWSATTRTLTGADLSSGSLATQSDVQTASSSVAAVVNANTNTQTSSIASSVNSHTDTIITTASSSLGSAISHVSSGSAGWVVTMSDFDSALAGGTYLARVTTAYNSDLADTNAAPTVTLYDANRNVVVSGVSMTHTATGVYEYSYTISSSASEGTWETVVSTQVESGKTLATNDYWSVVSAPAQVLIQSMGSTQTPNITANLRITNEGSVSYEYQYEWCVVTSPTNACGGGDDVYHATAAKLIAPGANFDTTLSATVPLAGTYYFKAVVYFATQSSVASRQFTATAPSTGTGNSGSGGGGGGGGGAPATVSQVASAGIGDLNGDGKVNGIDFSILLAFWKSSPPFKNSAVDLNHDSKVDSTDFSILLFHWTK